MALLLLFVFALMASGYVLKEGLRKKEKTTHELLLKCVIIITSVVPRQLPMQVRTWCFLLRFGFAGWLPVVGPPEFYRQTN
jgi:magnesium-transporting ATPase (P-type)